MSRVELRHSGPSFSPAALLSHPERPPTIRLYRDGDKAMTKSVSDPPLSLSLSFFFSRSVTHSIVCILLHLFQCFLVFSISLFYGFLCYSFLSLPPPSHHPETNVDAR